MAMVETLATFVDRRTMRHVRLYPHPIERVWEAVTRPEHLDAWMLPKCEIDLRLGGRWAFSFANPDPAQVVRGVITAFDPPRLVEYGAEGDETGAMRFELEPASGGTRLTFIHSFPAGHVATPSDDPGGDLPGGPDTPWKPGFVAGFHLMLNDLGDWLEGKPLKDAFVDGVHEVHRGVYDETWLALCETYRARIREMIPPR
jgi:uncharacterized protein YndB with AHSA1/START domain